MNLSERSWRVWRRDRHAILVGGPMPEPGDLVYHTTVVEVLQAELAALRESDDPDRTRLLKVIDQAASDLESDEPPVHVARYLRTHLLGESRAAERRGADERLF